MPGLVKRIVIDLGSLIAALLMNLGTVVLNCVLSTACGVNASTQAHTIIRHEEDKVG